MTNVEALKTLYTALGGEAADVENASTIVEVLNTIAAKYDGESDATLNAEAIANITAVVDNIIPESDNNAKFGVDSNHVATFNGIKSLEKITIPEGVKIIGNNAFSEAEKLVEIILPNTLQSIGQKAFDYCKGLTSIEIPASVTSISAEPMPAFNNCTNLETITINKPEGSISGAPWGAPSTTQIIWNG